MTWLWFHWFYFVEFNFSGQWVHFFSSFLNCITVFRTIFWALHPSPKQPVWAYWACISQVFWLALLLCWWPQEASNLKRLQLLLSFCATTRCFHHGLWFWPRMGVFPRHSAAAHISDDGLGARSLVCTAGKKPFFCGFLYVFLFFCVFPVFFFVCFLFFFVFPDGVWWNYRTCSFSSCTTVNILWTNVLHANPTFHWKWLCNSKRNSDTLVKTKKNTCDKLSKRGYPGLGNFRKSEDPKSSGFSGPMIYSGGEQLHCCLWTSSTLAWGTSTFVSDDAGVSADFGACGW